jgi:hypothetical protein
VVLALRLENVCFCSGCILEQKGFDESRADAPPGINEPAQDEMKEYAAKLSKWRKDVHDGCILNGESFIRLIRIMHDARAPLMHFLCHLEKSQAQRQKSIRDGSASSWDFDTNGPLAKVVCQAPCHGVQPMLTAYRVSDHHWLLPLEGTDVRINHFALKAKLVGPYGLLSASAHPASDSFL